MSTLRLQKRLASAVLKCGKNKVWLDPNETNEIAKGWSDHPQAREGALPCPCQEERPRPSQGSPHGPWQEEGYSQRPYAGQDHLDPSHARPQEPPPQVPRGQEDRQASVPRAVPEEQGQRLQEQAHPHGVHPQAQGREGPHQAPQRPGRGEAHKGQGGAQAARGAPGTEEAGDAQVVRKGGRELKKIKCVIVIVCVIKSYTVKKK